MGLFKFSVTKQRVLTMCIEAESNQENPKHKQKTTYLLKLKKENEAIKDRTIRDVKQFFELEEDCYKPIRLSNFP